MWTLLSANPSPSIYPLDVCSSRFIFILHLFSLHLLSHKPHFLPWPWASSPYSWLPKLQIPGHFLLYLDALQDSKLRTPKTELNLPLKTCCLFILLISVNSTASHSLSQPRNLILPYPPPSHPSFSTSQWILSTASQKLIPPSTKSSC